MQFKETIKKIGSKAKAIGQVAVRASGTGLYAVGGVFRKAGLKMMKCGKAAPAPSSENVENNLSA